MRSNYLKILKTAVLAVCVLLLGVSVSVAQQTINLTAQPTTLTTPDGSVVPMWGYACGTLVTTATATCRALNPNAPVATATTPAGWSPVVITVPVATTGATSLTINLTNNLTFTPTSATTANTVPTSLVIVGQVGGGLGTTATSTLSPDHTALQSNTVTWATVGGSPGFMPPPQGLRVQSFAGEVSAVAATTTATCTAFSAGTTATGCGTLTWSNLKPGTYLIESGTHPSIQGPMGLYGMLVVTTAPAGTTAGTAYPAVTAVANVRAAVPAVTYNAEVPLLFSEIDPIQNNAVNAAVNTANFAETTVWSGQPGGCGNPGSATYHTCYPPAVNYTPTYYMINGVAFNKTNAAASLFPTVPAGTTASPTTGTVLVRLVNAGLRMHVPSIVGSQTAGVTGAGVANPAVTGFSLVAEDGNELPGVPRVQNEVFMAAGKTYDVMINAPAAGTTATPVYDRELSLSGGVISRDAGMLAYIGFNGSTLPAALTTTATARNDTYNSVISGQTLTVSDPAKGVIANDTNVYGVTLIPNSVAGGTVTLNRDGTFSFAATATSGSFTYCANGSVSATNVCSSGITASVTLSAATIEASTAITCVAPITFSSNVATYIAVKTPGVLASCKDAAGYPLTAVLASGTGVTLDANGGFTMTGTSGTSPTFTFQAKNSQGTLSAAVTATVVFPTASNLAVTVLDGADKTTVISDYRWVIEEDRTFYIDPNCTTNPPPTGCPTATAGIVPTLGVNFHTSYMPYVAQGCTGPQSCEYGQTQINPATGAHSNVVCDVGNGACRADNGNGTTSGGSTWVNPSQVHLDPTKRYFISVFPGDAANPFGAGGYGGAPDCSTAGRAAGHCGHGMGGAPIGIDPNTHVQQTAVTVYSQPSPYPTGKLSVFVFEDDFPLNGEQDGGGGTGSVDSNNEPGLGGFQIHLWDAFGGNGDFTGQMGFDMFNQPLSNSLAGTLDPTNGNDACPVSTNPRQGTNDPTQTGITGFIVTCPRYESDGKTPSPLAGQAVIANLMPGRWGVIATPGADRIARGEEWLQTNTLDGQKAHDVFTRIGEPSFFQEFGPASFHVSIGFANPAIINGRHAGVCNGSDVHFPNGSPINCHNTITGRVVGERLSRTPDERLYGSGSHDAFYWSQCYVSFGDPDGEDFAFTKCNADGTFALSGLPDGDWRITTFDQWNDQLVDGLSTPVRLAAGGTNATTNIGDIAATQWQTNLYTKTFIDDNKDGLAQATEIGIPFANVAVRLRDGSLENLLVTDFTGTANFNETFPLFSWYTVETDVTRYKNTGTHVVYDVGGPADGSPSCGATGYPPCGNSVIGKFLANTAEVISVPTTLRVPGAVYCGAGTGQAGADCTGKSITGLTGSTASDSPSVCTTTTGNPPTTTCSTTLSSGRIDPPWVGVEGWQGFPGQNSFLEFGKAPYFDGENGGIKGHVIYASTRPFDDPQMLVQTQWEPLVPNVGINLYQEGVAADGITPTLTLVDRTKTSSFDDWAQGFRADGVTPNMNCPGQGASTGPNPDLFFFSLYNQPNYLNFYNSQHGGPAATALPSNSQFKCYDGMHNWNQVQPAPYDGMYQFPSVTSVDVNGRPNATNCSICIADPVPTTGADADPLRSGLPMLPPGKYVVEVVLPPGFELVKEEDKNILIGDDFIAPATQQFGGLGNVFIVPDQASVAEYSNAGQGGFNSVGAAGYNANNPQNPTQSFGMAPANGIVPGFVPEPTWPCVGEARIVPDFISLFPQTHQVAPFAGATRNLCDRKEVTLSDKAGAIAKFYIYTSTHIASKFTGGITDDYTSEFDPFSPQFGEKFAPPDLPVSIKDWTGTEINRVHADHWGSYDGMTYSTWEVNPPNPTGYSPGMFVFCMNDPGPITDTRTTIPNSQGTGTIANPTLGKLITDPSFTEGYSQFCYELPFMPATTQYLDTPVVPTSAFAGAGYNNVDCAYPTLTPAVSEVDGDGVGPWVSAAGHTLTIKALGDQSVPNYAYNGPSATTAPYNQKTITRHYGFGGQCSTPTAGNATCNTKSSVTIGGVSATITGWSDTTITVAAPTGVPNCATQQQAIYGGSTASCGQVVITAGNGRQSIDTVTVTIGGKAPTHVAASASIQTAIDTAQPGDLIMVDPTCTTTTAGVVSQVACTTAGASTGPAAHNELLLMWKPVRLQGVGAASSIINANTHPAGKLDGWRRQVDCLFGLTLLGTPISSTPVGTDPNANPFDSTQTFSCPGTGWVGFSGFDEGTGQFNPTVDRLPLEATVGWDAELNGNLAELLQEPSLMGALEGAGITVLGKGVSFPSDPYASGLLGAFPTGTTLLTASNCLSGTSNPFPTNFFCNPSSIDGLGITNSSQGGGAIFLHGWDHGVQIGNNRLYNNAGSLSGGINLGQGEYPAATIKGGTTNAAPYEANSNFCAQGSVANGAVLPYCFNVGVNMHNNDISLNSSTGDELFSATPAGSGGASFCTGADYYKFNYNWVCGNLSSGDGGGIGHMGFSYGGDIEHNSILFNQSLNPTIPANGGGMLVMGTPDADLVCNNNATVDADCPPPSTAAGIVAAGIGPSDGTGPLLTINANLIMGNGAEVGTGGGVAFLAVNGSDVVAFPQTPAQWNKVNFTNNIVANNVAGWDGAGISLLDSLNVNIVNNTIISNASTASAGILFNTLGAPLASQGGSSCSTSSTTSCPQPGGLVAIQNSSVFTANLPANVTCPPGHYQGVAALNGTCRTYSYPELYNDVFWQNSSYYIGVGAAINAQYQQNVVSLYNAFTTTLAASQTTTGQCVPGTSYWDIGVRGDTGPTNHGSGVTLAPNYSVLTQTTGYTGTGISLTAANPTVVSQYCNGSRTPPESGASGWAVPPGISDATVPNPIFNLTPVATVDEGNNWVNLRWGPLSLLNPVTSNATTNNVLANYALAAGSPAIDFIPTSQTLPSGALPTLAIDFFGNPRPDAGNATHIDVGAVEFQAAAPAAVASVTGGPLAFGNVPINTTSGPRQLVLHNTGGAGLTGIALAFTGPYSRPTGTAGGTCGTTLGAGTTCTINVVFSPTALGSAPGSLAIAASVTVTGSPVTLSGTGVAQVMTARFAPATWTTAATRGCSPSSCPAQLFTLTNTGNVTLTGITQGTITGATEFSVIRLMSTCGPAVGGQMMGITTLAPGASCVITGTFAPPTGDTTGTKNATLSVTAGAAGAQTSTLTGTAN